MSRIHYSRADRRYNVDGKLLNPRAAARAALLTEVSNQGAVDASHGFAQTYDRYGQLYLTQSLPFDTSNALISAAASLAIEIPGYRSD